LPTAKQAKTLLSPKQTNIGLGSGMKPAQKQTAASTNLYKAQSPKTTHHQTTTKENKTGL
jgi:hypothetical protein